MKKLLLATTVLTLSAGVAAADVTLSGDARMGVTYDNTADNKAGFTSRARVTFTLSGETDSGMAFGASFRADNSLIGVDFTEDEFEDAVTPGAAFGSAGSVFISGEFGRLTMGDTNGATEQVTGDLHGVGLTGLGDRNEFTYLGNTGSLRPTARYDYTIEGFTVAISHTNPSNDLKVAAIGAGYTFEGFTVGLGAERETGGPAATRTHGVISAAYAIDGISVKAMYGRLTQSGADNANQYGLSASGTFDAVTVSAFGRQDFNKDRHIGIGASYDLGGGASLKGGIVNTNFDADVKSRTRADMGLAFTF
ncbi:outer membrane protein OmpU [Roseinatronobacter thiooxidans]|uniref:Outer membrane protein OmpU n=1 Tax=Roseinatronobacter thiooxidans TaxID=121821 RepID=A0A2W7QDC7_9RHOB|nr:porin [Roseinatronobacter thiooxidans]PZX42117.1 outer membrane protein OmpU [Roseinatronobacter thiooxidans]